MVTEAIQRLCGINMSVFQIEIGEFFSFKEFDGKIRGPYERISPPENFTWACDEENVWFFSDIEKRPMYVNISRCYRSDVRDEDRAYVDGYRAGFKKAKTDFNQFIESMKV